MNYEESTKMNKHVELMKNWENEIIINNYESIQIRSKTHIAEIEVLWSC